MTKTEIIRAMLVQDHQHPDSPIRVAPPTETPCPCGEPTCVEPWEPGCGLGTSMEHARVAPGD